MNDKTPYVPYTKIISGLPFQKGDVVYVVSDILGVAKSCRDNGEKFDCEKFIESLQEAVGEEGTLLFSTFNWDFCKGITFDYYKTKGKTGALGNTAMRMPGFKRTRHPLYSFAVWGKDRDYLAHMDTISSFGEDSPFAYMHKKHAKSCVVGLTSLIGNTFIHYIEQSVGVVYRYNKEFTAGYIDESGNVSQKTFTMYVRDLDINAQHELQPMEQILVQLGIDKCYSINGIPYHVTDLDGLFDAGRLDVKYNQARNMYRY